jgi:6-phosphogluconolactonase
MKNLKVFNSLGTRLLLMMAFLIALMAGFTSPVAADGQKSLSGSVYTLTNNASENAVLVYSRSSNGNLVFQGSFSTGGLGSGDSLGSQGAVILSDNNQWLFAVNAGSNEISVFAVEEHGIKLVNVVDSSGERPISLTTHDELLYVLNAGGSGNISGFKIGHKGRLTPLSGSTQPLSNGGTGDAPGPAQVSFGSDGGTLAVTEKATNLIDTYKVEDGIAGAPITHPSSGATPFGFGFDNHDHMIVSEAFGGAAGASALSSYFVHEDEFNLISPSVATTQTAACWVAISKNGKYAYTTNAGSASISSYEIGKDGSLTLLNPIAGSTGASPVDMSFSNNGKFLYALSSGGHEINIFQMSANGNLAALGTVSVPAGVAGLAAR